MSKQKVTQPLGVPKIIAPKTISPQKIVPQPSKSRHNKPKIKISEPKVTQQLGSLPKAQQLIVTKPSKTFQKTQQQLIISQAPLSKSTPKEPHKSILKQQPSSFIDQLAGQLANNMTASAFSHVSNSHNNLDGDYAAASAIIANYINQNGENNDDELEDDDDLGDVDEYDDDEDDFEEDDDDNEYELGEDDDDDPSHTTKRKRKSFKGDAKEYEDFKNYFDELIETNVPRRYQHLSLKAMNGRKDVDLRKILKAIEAALLEHVKGDSDKCKLFRARYLGARRRARYIVRQESQPPAKSIKKLKTKISK